MYRILALLACTLLFCATVVVAEPVAVQPSATDPAIVTADNPHYAWTPTASPRGELVVFLPGTGGKPKEEFPFADVAAGLGYHVVSLMYPDGLAAQKVAGNSPDPDAHMKFRLAIIDGGTIAQHHGFRPIAPAEGIDNRLDRLLAYLSAHYPDQHWEQFIAADGSPVWEKIVVAGSSQGGGNAYVLGKLHRVARVLMFASPKDYSSHFERPAKGFDADTQTPLDRYFAFNHLRDNGNGCTHDQQAQILEQMKLTGLGIAQVENESAPWHHAHVLYTDADVPDGRFHGSVIKQDYSAVWAYMLSEPVQ